MLVTAIGTAGSTFTWPPLEIADRPLPSGLPVVGSNTIPALAAARVPSVVVTTAGAAQPVAEVLPSAQMKSPNNPVRSPERSAAVGTLVITDAARLRRVP